MITTKNKYTPSVNINRDNTVLENYIPTRNAIHAFNNWS